MNLDLDADTVVTDFEDAVLFAVSAVFGRHVQSWGCLYHFTQSTWRKIQSLGLTQHYRNDAEFRLFCEKLDGLAFLPHGGCPIWKESSERHCTRGSWGDVNIFWRKLCHRNIKKATGSRPELTGTHQATTDTTHYPPATWNVNQATRNDEAQTNNVCKGWKNMFSNSFGHSHPSLWKTIQ